MKMLYVSLFGLSLLLMVGCGDNAAVQTVTQTNTVTVEKTTPTKPPSNSGPSTQSPPSNKSARAGENDPLPTAVGESSITSIVSIGSRLVGQPDSGVSVNYANGGYQVSYNMDATVQDWQIGDAVKLLLVSIPSNCPPGDNRGKVYDATNLRTGETWEAPDSQHQCGGA
ncbi:MAG: hypothetical protein ACYC6Z_10135 [Thermoleophilia bacterium]